MTTTEKMRAVADLLEQMAEAIPPRSMTDASAEAMANSAARAALLDKAHDYRFAARDACSLPQAVDA
jgi:hypothetical protein